MIFLFSSSTNNSSSSTQAFVTSSSSMPVVTPLTSSSGYTYDQETPSIVLNIDVNDNNDELNRLLNEILSNAGLPITPEKDSALGLNFSFSTHDQTM